MLFEQEATAMTTTYRFSRTKSSPPRTGWRRMVFGSCRSPNEKPHAGSASSTITMWRATYVSWSARNDGSAAAGSDCCRAALPKCGHCGEDDYRRPLAHRHQRSRSKSDCVAYPTTGRRMQSVVANWKEPAMKTCLRSRTNVSFCPSDPRVNCVW